jgi:hypothetical protein
MTTRKELQAWLEQFPEDATIECLTSSTSSNGYESYTSVYETDLDLTEAVDPEFGTFAKTFEIQRNHTTGHVTICLGVKE